MTTEEKGKPMGIVPIESLLVIGNVVLALSLPFSGSLKTIASLFLLLVFLVQLLRGEGGPRMSAMHYGFLLLLLSGLMSTLFAAHPGKSLKGVRDILYYSIPFFVASTIHSHKHIRIILWSLYLSTALSALWGIAHSVELHRPLEIHSLGNQNYTGMFLVIVMTSMVSTVVFSERETLLQRSILILFSSLLLVASVMTQMRAAFLGLFAFLFILLFSKERSRLAVLLSVGFVCLAALAAYVDGKMWVKLSSSQSLTSRLGIWTHAIEYLKEHPLLGIGLNHFSHTFPLSYPVEPGNTVYDAHSLYFQVSSQMGIAGIVALGVLIVGFLHAWRTFKDTTGFGKSLKFGAMGAFLVITVTGLFDTTLHHGHAIAFSLITGLLFGYQSREEKEEIRRPGNQGERKSDGV